MLTDSAPATHDPSRRSSDPLDDFALPEASAARRSFVRCSRANATLRVHAILSHRFARLTEDMARPVRAGQGCGGDDLLARSNARWASEASSVMEGVDPAAFSDVGSMLREVVRGLRAIAVDRRAPPDYVRAKCFAIVERLWFESACA